MSILTEVTHRNPSRQGGFGRQELRHIQAVISAKHGLAVAVKMRFFVDNGRKNAHIMDLFVATFWALDATARPR